MSLPRLFLVVLCALLATPAVAGLHRFELENGLSVVLQPAPASAHGERIAMRLVVGVGTAHERTGHHGWAHLVEHMAFLGAGRFSRADIARLFDQAGLRHGRDLNAYTAERHTVYSASVPRLRQDVFRDSLDLMQAWLSDLRIDPIALDLEKGVVRAELLSAESQGERETAIRWRQLMEPALHRLRRQSGDDVRVANAEALHRFWASHYRPDNATLVLAGDFDSDEVLALVEDRFGSTRLGPVHPPLTVAPLGPAPRTESALVQYNSDILEPQLTLAMLRHAPGTDYRAVNITMESLLGWWRASDAVQQLCGEVHRERLRLSGGGEGDFFILSPVQTRVADCLTQLEFAIEAGLNAQAAHGSMRWLASIRAGLQRAAYAPAASASLAADALVSRLTAGLSVRRSTDEAEATAALLANLSVDDTRALIASTLSQIRTVVAFEGVDRSVPLPPTERLQLAVQRIRGWEPIEAGPDSPTAVVPTLAETPVHLPQPRARIASEVFDDTTRTRVIMLESGVRVHHVPAETPRSQVAVMVVNRNNVLQHAVSLENAVRVMPALFDQLTVEAAPPSPVAVANGVGVQASLFVETTRQGLILDVPSSALGSAFALVGHALRTGAVPATLPERVLQRVQDRWHSTGFGNARQLRRVLTESLYAVERQPASQAPSIADLRLAHTQFFANAAETDVFVIGPMPAALLRHVTTEHLGGMVARTDTKALHHTPSPRNRQIRVRTSSQVADVSIHYLQSQANGLDQRSASLIALQAAFEKALWQTLRDESGLVYQLSVQLLRRPFDRGGASLVVHTQSAPEHVATVAAAIDSVVTSLQTTPINAQDFERLRAQWLHDRAERLTASTGVMFEYALLREHGLDYPDIQRVTDDLRLIDATALRAFAAQFFDESGRVSLVLSPEEKQVNTELVSDFDHQPG